MSHQRSMYNNRKQEEELKRLTLVHPNNHERKVRKLLPEASKNRKSQFPETRESPRDHLQPIGPTPSKIAVAVPILSPVPTPANSAIANRPTPDSPARRKGKAPAGRTIAKHAQSSPDEEEELQRPAKRRRRYHIITADSDDDSNDAITLPERNGNNGQHPVDGQDPPAPAGGAIVPPIPQNNQQQPVRTIRDYLAEDLEGLNPAVTIPEFEAEHFEIKLVMFNMLNTLDQFGGSPAENARQHLKPFLEICNSFKIHGVSNDVLKLKLFPYSLRDKAKA
ncbi:hypothetical protein GQ457_08G027420 [Hibiscus cannabinus]